MEPSTVIESAPSDRGSDESAVSDEAKQLYRAGGGVSRWQMFWIGVAILYRDFPLLLWRAWVDTKARYRRSVLGPYWLTIGTLTFVAGYSILAGLLFKRPLEEFLGYIAAGVITWQFISTNIAEGSKIFVSDAVNLNRSTAAQEILHFSNIFLMIGKKNIYYKILGPNNYFNNVNVVNNSCIGRNNSGKRSLFPKSVARR